MDNRRLLPAISAAITLTCTSIPLSAYSQPGFSPYASSPTSSAVPSPDIISRKAHELAHHVTAKNKFQRLLTYDPNITGGSTKYQGIQLTLNISGWHYTIWLANTQESTPLNQPDRLSIYLRPISSPPTEPSIIFTDNDLDGKCDYALIPQQFSPTSQAISYQSPSPSTTSSGIISPPAPIQNLYSQTLDRLLKFYQTD